MRLARVMLRVSDVERSRRFWEEVVGLEVVSAAGPFVFLDGDGVQVALNQVDGTVEDESLTELVFELEDVVGAYNELAERGVPFEVELRPVTSDGELDLMAAHFRDPDGHYASVTGWVRLEPVQMP